MNLFIRLYCDEDVSVFVADLVRQRGHDVRTVQDVGRFGLSDESQLEYAARSGRCLLTHNRADFEKLAIDYFETGRSHCGIIVAVRHRPYDLAERLLSVLDTTTADEMQNQMRYI